MLGGNMSDALGLHLLYAPLQHGFVKQKIGECWDESSYGVGPSGGHYEAFPQPIKLELGSIFVCKKAQVRFEVEKGLVLLRVKSVGRLSLNTQLG